MGGTHSTVSAESITESLLSVMVTIATDAAGTASSVNDIRLSGHCQVDHTTLDQTNYIRLDAEIVQTISSEASADQDLDEKITEISEATAPNLNLNPGSEDSTTLTNLINNLSTELVQNIGANCTLNAQNVNTFECTDNAGASYLMVKQDQLGDYLFDCTQDVQAVSDAKTQLQTFIDDHSKAENKDVITGILIVIAVIIALIIIGYVLMKSKGGGGTTKDVQIKMVETKTKEMANQLEVRDCAQFLNFENCYGAGCFWNSSPNICQKDPP